jgi:aspartate/methionine/tyrosine aminotransferase
MHLSSRLDTFDLSGTESELAAAARTLREAGQSILDLTTSNPTRAALEYPAEAIREAISKPEILVYQPDPKGLRSAREAVAEYYGARGWDVDPDRIILTSGTSEAYSYLLKLLCDPGDEVLVPEPSYPLFDYLAKLENVELVLYPLRNPFVFAIPGDRWEIDFASLTKRLTPKARAIILVQPNNPTGNVVTAEEARRLVTVAEEHGLALIVDEVFCDYVFPGTEFCPVRSGTAPVFTLNGVSKILALPQMKLSWILIEGAPKLVDTAREGLELIADTFLSVNTPMQTALPELLPLKSRFQQPVMARLQTNLAAAHSILHAHPAIRCLTPQAGWYLVLQADTRTDDETLAIALLREKHVYLHPGYMFGFDHGCYLVLSLLTPEAPFKEGLQRLADFLA